MDRLTKKEKINEMLQKIKSKLLDDIRVADSNSCDEYYPASIFANQDDIDECIDMLESVESELEEL